MKAFNFKPLANVRTQKDEFSENITATSVVGGFRIPPKPAMLLGVTDYSAVTPFSDLDEETGELTIYIAKGHAGTIARDEEGNIITGGRNATTFEESDPIDGSLVRVSAPDSKILTFTSSATWKALGGATDKELVISLESIGVMEYPLPSGNFVEGEVFKLKVIKEREVNTRQRGEKTTDPGTTDEDVAAALENEEFEEEEA